MPFSVFEFKDPLAETDLAACNEPRHFYHDEVIQENSAPFFTHSLA